MYLEEVWAASAARTTSGDSGVLGDNYGLFSTLRVEVDVTAVAGTSPTLTVTVQDSLDGTNWNAVAATASLTAVGRTVLNVTTPFARRLRVAWAVGGTAPSFTFAVRAAVQGASS